MGSQGRSEFLNSNAIALSKILFFGQKDALVIDNLGCDIDGCFRFHGDDDGIARSSIELDQIYVTLRATRERAVRAHTVRAPGEPGDEDEWLKTEAAFAPGEAQPVWVTLRSAADSPAPAAP